MANEFFRRGVSRVFVVPTITNLGAMTVAQATAGTEITDRVADIAGFKFANSRIALPKLSTTFTGTIPGEDTADDSSLTFYEPKATDTLRTTLAKGTITNIVIFFRGTAGANPAVGDTYEAWPVQVASIPREYSMGNDPARWMSEFGTTAPPATDGVMVA
jgi:hypothetical protein